ncbi:MAG: TldD/PmbA family protein [Candidatus ainarchaeum sp.]|nr:TldD/PmbA family protein [Candidatus ainarchaeum sp.]
MEYERVLSRYGYADLRIERSSGSYVQITNDEVRHASGTSEGMGVRVLENGSWGFASSNRGEPLGSLLERARKLALLGRGGIRLALPKCVRKRVRQRPADTDIGAQVKALLEAGRGMKAKGVAARTLSCSDSCSVQEFYNSEGAEIVQETGYTYLSCTCTARSGELIQRGSTRSWSRKGFGKIDLSVAGGAKDKALRLLRAAPAPKGRFTVVFDPEMTGVFSHEAVGHACEADAVLDRESILAGKIGKRIGNALVGIADDPTADDFGRYAYDDEGVQARRTVLVEGGVLKGFINSMETAKALGLQPNGHARAQGYDSVPIVRMGNTYFRKGDASLDDVFDVKEGIYLRGMRGGSVDTFSGGFMFKAEEAYLIRGGEKKGLLRDAAISGNILKTLHDVESVGRDFGGSPGMCGKNGQSVPVSDGGPHIRVGNVAIG